MAYMLMIEKRYNLASNGFKNVFCTNLWLVDFNKVHGGIFAKEMWLHCWYARVAPLALKSISVKSMYYVMCRYVNTSSPGAAYMHQWIRLALAKIMACCLFSIKPLSEPMLGYCQLDTEEQTSKYKTFHSRKCIWKYCLRNDSHFVRGRWDNIQFNFHVQYPVLLFYCNNGNLHVHVITFWSIHI